MRDQSIIDLIRHAEPDSDSGGRICLGRKLDPPLSAAGREQAALLGQRMKEAHWDVVYSSPLLRARQTADALQQRCPHRIAEELTEVCSGEWDGMYFSDIYKQYPEYFDLAGTEGDKTPPGGESDEEALARVMPFLESLIEDRGTRFALVTHSGLGRILICSLLGLPMHRKRTIPMKYASCTELCFEKGMWKVQLAEDFLG